MDEFYDKAAAGNIFDSVTEESSIATSRASTISITEYDPSQYRLIVKQVAKPKLWSLVLETTNDPTDSRDAIFCVKGVIFSKSLPPFDADQFPRNESKYKYLRQHLEIVGLNTQYFEKGIQSLAVLHGIFERHFPEGQLETWSPKISSDMLAFECSNRLFTPSFDADIEKVVPIPQDWDPSGKLSSVSNDKYRFCDNNLVLYFKRTKNESSEKLLLAQPVIFRVGDIVEVEFVLNVVQIARKMYRMLSTMRAVTLLDDTCTRNASLARLQDKIPRSLSSKRQRSAGDEMDVSTNTSVSRMRVD